MFPAVATWAYLVVHCIDQTSSQCHFSNAAEDSKVWMDGDDPKPNRPPTSARRWLLEETWARLVGEGKPKDPRDADLI